MVLNFIKSTALVCAAMVAVSCGDKSRQAVANNNEKTVKSVMLDSDFERALIDDIVNNNIEEKYNEETLSIIDDSILPRPELDFCSPFDIENDVTADNYYEEFKEFNVPMAMTSRVSAYIKYFTQRVPKTTQAWLDRSNKYMYLVQDIFIKEGLPSDLVVLAFTESGYNTHAISHAGAAGMWQFIPSTGKIYGMENNFWVDERRDFEKATHAAAQYLKNLYNRFDDWYLALAAYNAGPGRIARATKKHGSQDFFTISKSRHTLKLETRDYVPKFLAQLIIYKNYLKYNFTPPTVMPLLFSNITVPSQTNLYWLAGRMGITAEALIELNPALKLPITPPSDSYPLRVPYGMASIAEGVIKYSTADERSVYKVYNAKQGEKIASIAKKFNATVTDIKSLNSLNFDTVYGARPIFIPIKGNGDRNTDMVFTKALSKLVPSYYVVRRGDTFIGIAHKYNMRQYELQRLNPKIKVSRIYPGQQLVVSEGTGTAKRAVAKKAAPAKKSTSKAVLTSQGKYKVRPGDSLWSISRKFGVTVDDIMAQNNLDSHGIQAGKTLIIHR